MSPSFAAVPFSSFEALRGKHAELFRRARTNPNELALLHQIQLFIAQGRMTGTILDSESDRTAAQAILDYWATVPLQLGGEMPDSTLAEFDENQAPALPDEACPYVGLDAFGPDRAGLFFGRERVISDRVNYVKRHRLITIIGPSGSGKSSLVLAGILPRLKAGAIPADRNTPPSNEWIYAGPLVPGSSPRQYLADLFNPPKDIPALYVIDQFEELFTLCENRQERDEIIQAILNLIEMPAPRHTVILTMRRDHEHHVQLYSQFQKRFERAKYEITPLRSGELRDAIEGPAVRIGLKFDPGVVEKLVEDIIGQATALPLLQFALLKLWMARRRNRITHEVYKQVGSARDALRHSADQAFYRLLTEQQRAAQRIFIELTKRSYQQEFVSSRVRRSVIFQLAPKEQVEAVLREFTAEGLLRISAAADPNDVQIEVAHEALVRNWPMLGTWLENHRDEIRRRMRLVEAAEQWKAYNYDPGSLWSGLQLVETEQYSDLSELESKFLAASRQKVDEDNRKEKERANFERDIAIAQREREILKRKLLTRFLITLAIGFLVALGLAIFAFNSWRAGTRTLRLAQSRELAMNAITLRNPDPQLSLLLALEAVRVSPQPVPPEAFDALATLARPISLATLRCDGCPGSSHRGLVFKVVFDSSGERLATAGFDSVARVWTNKGNKWAETHVLKHEANVWGVTFNPAGNLLATSSEDGIVRLWDPLTGQEKRQYAIGKAASPRGLAFSPDGSSLAIARDDGKITIVTGETFREIHASKEPVWRVAFSPDGSTLASASHDRRAVLWDLSTGQRMTTFAGHRDRVYSLAFSPDGKRLATASVDRTARVWDIASGKTLLSLESHTDAVVDVAFSPDTKGARLATASLDNSARLWDSATGKEIEVFREHADSVLGVAFHPSGRMLATSSEDRMVKIWPVSLGGRGHQGGIWGIGFSRDGLKVGTASYDQTARIWDVQASADGISFSPTAPVVLQHAERVHGVAFNPVADSVATGSLDGKAAIWDFAGNQQVLFEHPKPVTEVAFSPNGALLATASWDNNVRIWNATDRGVIRKPIKVLSGHKDWAYAVAFSPDGSLLASGSRDRSIVLWDPASGAQRSSCVGHEGSIYGLSFDPSGRYLAAASSDLSARVFRIRNQSGSVQCSQVAVLRHSGSVRKVIFSSNPNEYMIATAGGDDAARLWKRVKSDPEEWQEAGRISHDGPVRAVAFSHNGSYLATAALDANPAVFLTPVGIDSLEQAARKRVNRQLTDAECEKYLHRPTCNAK